jgi:Protein of unknown function (DUF2585)
MTSMFGKSWRTWPTWLCAAAGAALIGLAAAAELAMGRKPWGVSGEPGIWSGNIWSAHNSQYMTDPYTFSHLTHGVLWYGLLSPLAKRLPVRARFVLAVALECAWEVFENTDLVIRRYRAATVSLNYYGDSVVNSMCDMVAALAGFVLAAILPTRVTLVGVIVLEIALALWIRDSLLLNLLMLVRPIQAIRNWQLAK